MKVEQYIITQLSYGTIDDNNEWQQEDLENYQEDKQRPFEELLDRLEEYYWQSDSAAMNTEIIGLVSIEYADDGKIIQVIKQVKKDCSLAKGS